MEHEKDYQPDILGFLEKVVHKNTLAYAEDFNMDKITLQLSADESDVEHRSFLWMSRPHGHTSPNLLGRCPARQRRGTGSWKTLPEK